MSGNAALSAARKRRASSTPMNSGNVNTQTSGYYNRSTPTVQQLMNQPFPEQHNERLNGSSNREHIQTLPINIYENIELIRQQILARTNMMQTQGSAIPPDRMRVLQKQNEIQTQILQQKIAIAQQMEQEERLKVQHQEKEIQQQLVIPSINEPEFIYEKGIPRKNPKYKTPAEIEAMKEAQAIAHQVQAQAQALHKSKSLGVSHIHMTPFVSMISDSGVIPPPIVIMKAHDVKLQEHNNAIQHLIRQMDELVENVSNTNTHIRESKSDSKTIIQTHDDHDHDRDEDEPELLMEVVMNDLTNSREFVEGIVDKIVNDTNLSEVIMKIEPLVKENQELRSLIHSQQQMMNEMNTLLLRLLNKNNTSSVICDEELPESYIEQESEKDETLDVDGLYTSDIREIVLSNYENDNKESYNEPAHIIDEPEPEPEAEPQREMCSEDKTHIVNDTYRDEEASTMTTEEAYDTEMPHFPEQIALVVSEI